MSNWKPHADLSHPNWTGRPQHQSRHPLKRQEKEPGVWAQIVLGVLFATTFMLGMYAL